MNRGDTPPGSQGLSSALLGGPPHRVNPDTFLVVSLRSSSPISLSRGQALTTDRRVGSFGVSFREPHQYALGRVALLPEDGEEAFFIARVDDAGEVRLDVENHPRWLCRISGVTRVAFPTRTCRSAVLLAAIPPCSMLSGLSSYPLGLCTVNLVAVSYPSTLLPLTHPPELPPPRDNFLVSPRLLRPTIGRSSLASDSFLGLPMPMPMRLDVPPSVGTPWPALQISWAPCLSQSAPVGPGV